MGKKGGTSWLTVVKRAFRSPSKNEDKKSSRRREENEQEEEEQKREKRRWLFRRAPSNTHEHQREATNNSAPLMNAQCMAADRRHAIAVATATVAAAEAAAATAQAAVEIIRLTTPSSTSLREHNAAIVIQTCFRGYLARRALRALQGIVKLQALVRGQNVRRQTKMTLKCMQALFRVQARVHDHRARPSLEATRKSMFAESNNLWESKYMQDVRERKSIVSFFYKLEYYLMAEALSPQYPYISSNKSLLDSHFVQHSRAGSYNADNWDDCPRTLEELDAILQTRKEAAALNHEKTLARAFSQQIWDSGRNASTGDEKELDERTNWLDRWMATKQWETDRSSTDKRETTKTLEMDTSRPYCYSTHRISTSQSQHQNQRQSSARSFASPRHRASYPQPPLTPSPSRVRPLHVRSASPRCPKEERSYSTANTPCLVSRHGSELGAWNYAMPNYMAATESAKARFRSQSATRQRPSTPERERSGSVKKRLSYLVPEPYSNVGIGGSGFCQNLRSPSFKSVQAGFLGVEHGSNLSSCYTESVGGEISPCSTTDLRRWFR
ncbi:hypothetical protein RHMOL_Rhmol02G0314600 [Rhododendron molle]|uniref:Uncharacterized protein n=1 Tax=Rhododendron molle TaxID=49168 RepID=A0ACC0PXL1_RHOML|nr:hypothetical protein RHMOL_Rhmol02G0314600 [Rhododendron molle]